MTIKVIVTFFYTPVALVPQTCKMDVLLRRNKKEQPVVNTILRASIFCGILSSLLYVAMTVFIPRLYDGYDPVSQTVSEISAIGAPTRKLWVLLGIIYTLLVAIFGWGVWKSAGNNRQLRITGGLLFAYGAIGLFWPFAPMHQREVIAGGGGTHSDTMHIVFSMVTVVIMMLAMGFGGRTSGKQFRLYSIMTIAVLFVLGAWTGMEGVKLNLNLPTPWLGIIERILIGGFLLWVVVLAYLLLRSPGRQEQKKTRIEEKFNKSVLY